MCQESHKHWELRPKNTVHRTRAWPTLSPPVTVKVATNPSCRSHGCMASTPHAFAKQAYLSRGLHSNLGTWTTHSTLFSCYWIIPQDQGRKLHPFGRCIYLSKSRGCHSVNWSRSVLLEGQVLFPKSLLLLLWVVVSQWKSLFSISHYLDRMSRFWAGVCCALCLSAGEKTQLALLEFAAI